MELFAFLHRAIVVTVTLGWMPIVARLLICALSLCVEVADGTILLASRRSARELLPIVWGVHRLTWFVWTWIDVLFLSFGPFSCVIAFAFPFVLAFKAFASFIFAFTAFVSLFSFVSLGFVWSPSVGGGRAVLRRRFPSLPFSSAFFPVLPFAFWRIALRWRCAFLWLFVTLTSGASDVLQWATSWAAERTVFVSVVGWTPAFWAIVLFAHLGNESEIVWKRAESCSNGTPVFSLKLFYKECINGFDNVLICEITQSTGFFSCFQHVEVLHDGRVSANDGDIDPCFHSESERSNDFFILFNASKPCVLETSKIPTQHFDVVHRIDDFVVSVVGMLWAS